MVEPLYPKHIRALVVEDNRDDAAILTRALKTFGIDKCSVVDTGEDALAFLADETCDVVFIDYRLPRMNGLDLLERICESWPEILAIMVTGARDERIAVSAMKLGAVDYVTKDGILTGNIIRSLQAAVRQRIACRDKERREVLSSGENKIEVASAETGWLLESLVPSVAVGAYQRSGLASPEYGAEFWPDLLDTAFRYLRESFSQFPFVATKEEDALVRASLERGLGAQAVVAVFRAALRSLLTEPDGLGTEPPFNPTICLARILARLVDEYQRQLSVMERGEKTA
jgi:CheY-like chemotaxis protein